MVIIVSTKIVSIKLVGKMVFDKRIVTSAACFIIFLLMELLGTGAQSY